MSYRIHKGMGYGLSIKDFRKYSSCPDSHDEHRVGNWLYEQFDTEMSFEISKPDRKSLRGRFGFFCMGGDLVKPFDQKEGESPENLFNLVSTPDTCEWVMFAPNINYARRWFRYNDDLDYEFLRWINTDGSRGNQECDYNTRIVCPEYRFYPYSSNLMLADGAQKLWEDFTEVENHPEWLPAVPSEIRWYLNKLNIMTYEQSNHLCPVIAQWWS